MCLFRPLLPHPQQLIFAMTEKGKSLENVSVYHLHTEGATPYAHGRNVKAL